MSSDIGSDIRSEIRSNSVCTEGVIILIIIYIYHIACISIIYML